MDSETRPAVIWFTGLSGSGKSTVAARLAERLRKEGHRVELLDGDAIRAVFPNTGFTRADRDTHVKYVGLMASRLERHGVSVIASFVSPYEEARRAVRDLCQNFIEVFVSTPLAECERRDVKGLYARARRGEITNFTGVNDPYEAPGNPELTIDTSAVSVEHAGERILEVVRRRARSDAS